MTVSHVTRSATFSFALALYALARPEASIAAESTMPLGNRLDVVHYSARIEPDMSARTLKGAVAITYRNAGTETLFDAGSLQIDSVELGGKAVTFGRVGSTLRIPIPKRRSTRGVLQISYHGAPTYGLEFHPERDEVYTIFSTSQWLVVVDAPSERATLDLSIVMPAGYTVAATGSDVGGRTLASGAVEHRWRLRTPTPSFAYGFAAGRYTEAGGEAAGRRLHYLSTDRTPAELQQVFRDTPDMIRFFESRAGVPLRGDYTQILVADTVGQEAAGLALLSEAYGKSVLDDPFAESLIAHELAHQWWGISLTCKDWGHFWLNEGFATFMAADYLGQRYGHAEYLKQVERWKARVDRLRASGTDRALVYEQWSKPTADDRAVVYQKGAYVLHLLRQEMGEDAFWTGIQRYTRENQGHSVDTAAFIAAMSKAAGRHLSPFFETYGGQ